MFHGRQQLLETFLLFCAVVGGVTVALWLVYVAALTFFDGVRHRPRLQ
jgi:hypothetical protein